MIVIDGSEGEGGGQIIRSSLALSMITGKPFRVDNVRGKRKKPGLLRQHLTGVQLAREICNAAVTGDRLGSSTLEFIPDSIYPGDYHARIGTAGSSNLVLQTGLPALATLESSSSIRVTGGTHNDKSPPFHFLQRAFLPLLAKMGPACELELVRYGFYPAGGGEQVLHVEPAPWRGLSLLERTGRPKTKITAIVSKLDPSIAEREINTIRRKANWKNPESEVIVVPSPRGPGNVVLIEVAFDNVTEVFMELGKKGVRAEQVANRALKQAKAYLDQPNPVGEYLADQLLLPMGIAATSGHRSEFVSVPLSQHSRTQIDILKRFLNIEIVVAETADSAHVTVTPED